MERKHLLLIASMLLAGCLFAGCAPGDAEPTSPAELDTSGTTIIEDPVEDITLIEEIDPDAVTVAMLPDSAQPTDLDNNCIDCHADAARLEAVAEVVEEVESLSEGTG